MLGADSTEGVVGIAEVLVDQENAPSGSHYPGELRGCSVEVVHVVHDVECEDHGDRPP